MLEVLVIDRPCNRVQGQVAEQLPAQDLRRSLARVQVEKRGLVQDKESVPAPVPRIVPPRGRGKGSRIGRASRSSRQGCLDWVPAQRLELRQARWREIARRIDRKRRKIVEPA